MILMDIFWSTLLDNLLVALFVAPLLLGGYVLIEFIGSWRESRRQRRIAHIEADLDRTQEEMRQTILRLASHLGADAHEARKALIRESFLASGKVPPEPSPD